MDLTDRDGDTLMRRIMWRIMPLITGLMMLSVIDRSNVSYAKLQMVGSLGISETTYGLASSLFFIGSLVFEVPSALAAHRFGARFWFARILLTWGLLTVLLGFTFSGSLFAAARFLIGAAEAGAYPGIIFYLTLWFPKTLSRAGRRPDDDRQPARQHVRVPVRRAIAQSRRRTRSRRMAMGIRRDRPSGDAAVRADREIFARRSADRRLHRRPREGLAGQ